MGWHRQLQHHRRGDSACIDKQLPLLLLFSMPQKPTEVFAYHAPCLCRCRCRRCDAMIGKHCNVKGRTGRQGGESERVLIAVGCIQVVTPVAVVDCASLSRRLDAHEMNADCSSTLARTKETT